jgi:hypothetical protein
MSSLCILHSSLCISLRPLLKVRPMGYFVPLSYAAEPSIPASASWTRLVNNYWLHFGTLFLFALLLNREGTWVPSGNENIYLLYLWKGWHHSFLATDWTFQEPTAGHPVFNFLFGWLTRLMPLEVVGWIGRLCSWSVLLIALMRIGRHFRITPWMVWTGIMLWLIQRQSFVSNEWIIGTFEAKCVAYACLLFAIDQVLEGKLILPAMLVGLSFSFHSAVGLWGGAAVGLAFATQRPIGQTIKFGVIAMLFALPGIITSIPLMFGGHAITPDEAKFLVTIEMPFHLDPLVFGKGKILVLYIMLAFNMLHFWQNRKDEKLGFLIRFELFAGIFFALGILFRIMGKFDQVELFPFRVFAVMIMLMFFWHIATMYQHRREHQPSLLVVGLGIFAFFCLPSPVARLQSLAADQLPKWKMQSDDFVTCANWIRQNTAPETIVIAPPWRKDTFYRIQRPLIAHWHSPRYNAMTEWRERIESLVGDVSHMDIEDNLAGEMDQRARDYYQHLSHADIQQIVGKYGGDMLVTAGNYDYPVLFTSGEYKIYNLSHSAR